MLRETMYTTAVPGVSNSARAAMKKTGQWITGRVGLLMHRATTVSNFGIEKHWPGLFVQAYHPIPHGYASRDPRSWWRRRIDWRRSWQGRRSNHAVAPSFCCVATSQSAFAGEQVRQCDRSRGACDHADRSGGRVVDHRQG